jgi:hypothetical protein
MDKDGRQQRRKRKKHDLSALPDDVHSMLLFKETHHVIFFTLAFSAASYTRVNSEVQVLDRPPSSRPFTRHLSNIATRGPRDSPQHS